MTELSTFLLPVNFFHDRDTYMAHISKPDG